MADELRPPYVTFEVRAIENREKTIEAGHYVGEDVIFAIVTPAGTRDRVEKQVDDWLANLEEGVKQDRIPAEWLSYYRRRLADFQESRESPENGTAISDWPSVSPAQVKTLLDLNIRTVEDLATAHDEALNRIGMGGRALKQKAIIWLEASHDSGKLAQEVEALRIKNEELLAQDKEREERMKALEAKLEVLTQASKKTETEKA